MARKAFQKIYADFRQGLVDVSSKLQQPEGTVRDILNFDIEVDGTLSKRGGLQVTGVKSDALDLYDFDDETLGRKPSFFIWDNVANDVNKKFLVVSYGINTYRFYDISSGILDLAESIGYLYIPRETETTAGASLDDQPDFASALGQLFIASSTHEPTGVSYNPTTGVFTDTQYTLSVRDTEVWYGPSDSDTGVERNSGSEISHWHYFNLLNGGWPETANVAKDSKGEDGHYSGRNPIMWTKKKVGFYPEISIPYYSARNGVGTSVATQNAYSPWLVENNYFGNGTPPVGKNITEVSRFRRGGSIYLKPDTSSKVYSIEYIASEEPSSIAFYSGRLWYGNNSYYNSPKTVVTTIGPKTEKDLSGGARIYYSQTLDKDMDKAAKCYQANDPTVEDLNALLDTDGGVIFIKECGNIKKLVPLGTSLFVFADKGVWRIAGTDFNSFTPTAFAVDKISDIEILSKEVVVSTKNRIYALAVDGLYAIDYQGVVGDISLNDLSTPLIENFFDSMSTSVVRNSFLRYDDSSNVLYCFLPTEDDEGNLDKFRVKDLLLYKESLNAFYKHSFDYPDNYYPLDALYGLDSSIVPVQEAVVDESGDPLEVDGDPVVLEETFDVRTVNAYINMLFMEVNESEDTQVLVPATFSDKTYFLDFGEKEYEAEVELGFDSNGDLIIDNKQAPYISSYLSKPEQTLEQAYDFTNETVLPESIILQSSIFFDPSDASTTRCTPFANESARAVADGEGVVILLDKSENLNLGPELVTSTESGRMIDSDKSGFYNSYLFGTNEPCELQSGGVTTNFIEFPAEDYADEAIVLKVEVLGTSDKRVWLEHYDSASGKYSRDGLSTNTADITHLAEDYMVIWNSYGNRSYRFSCEGTGISVKAVKGNHFTDSNAVIGPDFDERDSTSGFILGIDGNGKRYIEGRRGLYRNTVLSAETISIASEDYVQDDEPLGVWASVSLQTFPITDGGTSDPYNSEQFLWKLGGYANFGTGTRVYQLQEDGSIKIKTIFGGYLGEYPTVAWLDVGVPFVDEHYQLDGERLIAYINGDKVWEETNSSYVDGLFSLLYLGDQPNYYTRTPRIYAFMAGNADYTEAELRTIRRYFAGLNGAALSETSYEVVGAVPTPQVSCKMSYSWDWSTNFSRDQELYRLNRMFIPENFDDAFEIPKEVVKNKSRIRGRGTSLNIKMVSEAGKACDLQGLSVMYTG